MAGPAKLGRAVCFCSVHVEAAMGKQWYGAIYYSDDHAGPGNSLLLPEGVNGPHDLLIDPDLYILKDVCILLALQGGGQGRRRRGH